jgi:large conductance mechanosensitive channel
MFKKWKQFMLRGNVLDLAVAVVIGAAFAAVINSLVTHIINPLIAALIGQPDFAAMTATVNNSEIKYGLFLNSLISFFLVATAIYFFVVAPVTALSERLRRGEPSPDPTTKTCRECLSAQPQPA